MSRIRDFWFRLQPFWRRSKIETGLSEEIQSHIAMATEANIAAGMSPREARYAALREFGGVEQIKEQYRDARGLRWLEDFFSDLRFAARSLRKSAGFTTVVVFTLALCIGANSAVFSVVHAILLKPYPWPDSERLVAIENTAPRNGRMRTLVGVADYLDRRNGVAAFEESALYYRAEFNLATIDSSPERIRAVVVTPSLFPLLKARPALGRTFVDDDAKVGAIKTVVLSHAFWQDRFGGNPSIIDSEIRLGGERHTVIGVMPPGFYFPNPGLSLWAPFVFTEQQKSNRQGQNNYDMVARLKAGATVEQAQHEINAIQKANEDRFPELRQRWVASGWAGVVKGFQENNVQDVRTLLWFLQGAVAAVLLIGCTNVASLLLARNAAHGRELAIRASLGASRGRLIRLLLMESVLLFAAGSLFGLLFAEWCVTSANNFGVRFWPGNVDVSLDGVVFGFTLLGASATGLAFGALPAWSATRGHTAEALKETGARVTTNRRHLKMRNTLVVTEIALALMLVATAALLIKSFHRVQSVNPGFDPENLLSTRIEVSSAKYDTAQKRALLHQELLERVRGMPGVVSVAWANQVLFAGGVMSNYRIEGYTPPPDQPGPNAFFETVSPDYFKTMGIPLLRGRVFNEYDTLSSADVVVIDKFLADRYWPGEDPIGKRLIWGSRPIPNSTKSEPVIRQIIGVVAVVKRGTLENSVVRETFYMPNLQNPAWTGALIVKTRGAPEQLTAALRTTVQAIDRELAIYDIMTMEARLERTLQRRRSPMLLLAMFAGIAMLLATIGVYGVLAFAVGQRTKEIGVRVALGATVANIVRMILRQGAILVALGLVLGLAGYFALSTLIRKLLFGVEATDLAALLVAPAMLALVALGACLIPARRATKVDPMVALRAE